MVTTGRIAAVAQIDESRLYKAVNENFQRIRPRPTTFNFVAVYNGSKLRTGGEVCYL